MGTKVQIGLRIMGAAQVAYLTGNIAVQHLLGSPQALVLMVSIPGEGLLHCKLQLGQLLLSLQATKAANTQACCYDHTAAPIPCSQASAKQTAAGHGAHSLIRTTCALLPDQRVLCSVWLLVWLLDHELQCSGSTGVQLGWGPSHSWESLVICGCRWLLRLWLHYLSSRRGPRQ